MCMISLTALLKESIIRYTHPNFDSEWEEAQRYPEFVEMGRLAWIKRGKAGYVVNYSQIKDILGNVDLDFNGLHPTKKKFVYPV